MGNEQRTCGQASSIDQTGLISIVYVPIISRHYIIISSYTRSVTAVAHELVMNKLAPDIW